MKVPFVDLLAQYEQIKQEIDTAINDVIVNNDFINGQTVYDFERFYEKIYGVKHCISVGNGTDSLFIIMKMLGIGEGDEVITTAHSWISTSETISLTGAQVVFCDIDEYFTIDASKIKSLITSKTKAIIPVHLAGQVCDMDEVMKIATDNNLFVIAKK